MRRPAIARELAAAVAEDAESLAALHDRELHPEMIVALRASDFAGSLALAPYTREAKAAWRAAAEGIASLPGPGDAKGIDLLAADYAAIYLTGAYGASPSESMWTDDDRLVCQAAMFTWRKLHGAAGLATPDWRQRADDHLVLQLQYLAHVLRRAATIAEWRVLATVLDEHCLRWIPLFATRVAARCEAPFYAGLAVLTAAWLESLRDLAARVLGEARPTRDAIEARLRPAREVPAVPVAFLPGVAPSW